MNKKILVYTIKLIAAAILAYGFLLGFGSIYSISHYGKIKDLLVSMGSKALYDHLIISAYLFIANGVLSMVGAVGLFFLKKFGYYLAVLSILMFWAVNWFQTHSLALRWTALIISAIIAVFLVYERRLILTSPRK